MIFWVLAIAETHNGSAVRFRSLAPVCSLPFRPTRALGRRNSFPGFRRHRSPLSGWRRSTAESSIRSGPAAESTQRLQSFFYLFDLSLRLILFPSQLLDHVSQV
jgi:hypothetical protein